jgi:hypothetical protein
MFARVEELLEQFAHVGVLCREGGHTAGTVEYETCTRMLRFLAYDVSVFRAARIQYDRLPVMEDFDTTLQLLRAGYPNAVLCTYVQGQGKTNAPGGCSRYRTPELQAAAAHALAKRHYPFVLVVTKRTKTAWGWGERTDVVIHWKKALSVSRGRQQVLL